MAGRDAAQPAVDDEAWVQCGQVYPRLAIDTSDMAHYTGMTHELWVINDMDDDVREWVLVFDAPSNLLPPCDLPVLETSKPHAIRGRRIRAHNHTVLRVCLGDPRCRDLSDPVMFVRVDRQAARAREDAARAAAEAAEAAEAVVQELREVQRSRAERRAVAAGLRFRRPPTVRESETAEELLADARDDRPGNAALRRRLVFYRKVLKGVLEHEVFDELMHAARARV